MGGSVNDSVGSDDRPAGAGSTSPSESCELLGCGGCRSNYFLRETENRKDCENNGRSKFGAK